MSLIRRSLSEVINKRKRIGEILIEKGLIQPEMLANALEVQKGEPRLIGEILIEEGALTCEDLYRSLAEQNGFEFQPQVEELDIDADTLSAVPKDQAEKWKFVPFKMENNLFWILTADATGTEVLDMVYFLTGRKAGKIIATPEFIEILINEKVLKIANRDLEKVGLDNIVDDVNLEFVKGDEEEGLNRMDINEISRLSSQATIINLVNKIILMAIKENASDIHVESFEDKVTIRFRIDGVLYEKMGAGFNILNPVVSRVMIMANMDITERFLPQDGSFKLKFEGRNIEFRVATVPTIFGLNTVIRLLNVAAAPADLRGLGFQPSDYETLKRIVEKPWGMFLVSGPTGSGKSTTLYSLLRSMKSSEVKMITIEDPVENKVDGIQQIQVKINKSDNKKSLTFAAGLRSILRLDPDIIMVGEIRDAETAEIAVRAAMTGHLIFSTIHANTAMETIRRLQNIGVDLFTTMSALNAVLAQRLVRILCKFCRVKKIPDPEILPFYNYRGYLNPKEEVYEKKGCEVCHNTGYFGRIGVFEFFEVTDEFRDLVNSKESITAMSQWALTSGFNPMIVDGLKKVQSGITSLSEIKRVLVGFQEGTDEYKG